jgi:flagellar biosynthesis/type III secretory pathway protein FliH
MSATLQGIQALIVDEVTEAIATAWNGGNVEGFAEGRHEGHQEGYNRGIREGKAMILEEPRRSTAFISDRPTSRDESAYCCTR